MLHFPDIERIYNKTSYEKFSTYHHGNDLASRL